MDRFECRKAVLAELDRMGLLAKLEAYQHSVGHCQRCDSVVEPHLSHQWFVRIKPLAEPALQVVREGKIRFVRQVCEDLYELAREHHDWCISRRL